MTNDLVLRTCGLNLFIHPARQHHRDHFIVAHKRPEGILKRSRSIFLDHKVSKPRCAVAWDEPQWKEIPSP